MWHTGWEKGKRKAVLRAGIQSPEHVYSGLIGDPGGLLSPDEAHVFQLHSPLPLHDQVCDQPQKGGIRLRDTMALSKLSPDFSCFSSSSAQLEYLTRMLLYTLPSEAMGTYPKVMLESLVSISQAKDSKSLYRRLATLSGCSAGGAV